VALVDRRLAAYSCGGSPGLVASLGENDAPGSLFTPMIRY